MKRPNKIDGKYFIGHIFLDGLYLKDVDKYIDRLQSQLKEKDEKISDLKKTIREQQDRLIAIRHFIRR